ncbi:hypothetical protein TNCV_709731 [Trichonephila clavipes]|nr:hypothetical protein TNCV_709731 [Trichonephila clavipes]
MEKGAIASRRLDFYLLVHGRYFISLLPPIGNQWRRSPIRHLGTRPLGVTGSPEGSCILQWIPAHVNIEGNECADSLAKEARDIEHKCTTITLDDANAVAKHRIMNHTFKKNPSYGI